MLQLFVRYTSGHRAGLTSGWHPYGEGEPLSADLAHLLASSVRHQGAEVRLEAVVSRETAPAQLALWSAA